MTLRPGRPCVSVSLQIGLVGRQSSDRLSHAISVRGTVTHHAHRDKHSDKAFVHTQKVSYNTDIRSGRDAAVRPRHAEVKYVWTKGHEGSSINTVTLLLDGSGLDRSVTNTHIFTHKDFEIKPSL